LTNTFNQLSIDLSFPDVNRVEHADVLERYLESCDHSIDGKSIIIAQSNASVAAFNRQIREVFFPRKTEITDGDKVCSL
jgi:hypothetical protein